EFDDRDDRDDRDREDEDRQYRDRGDEDRQYRDREDEDRQFDDDRPFDDDRQFDDDEFDDDEFDDDRFDDTVADAEPQRSWVDERNWPVIAFGAGLIFAGAVLDLALDSSNNGQLDAVDLLPLTLYGTGGFLVYRGVF
ncbi:MAG: hypothetical protein AAGC55_09280, partial [Myxococcota bacterium]